MVMSLHFIDFEVFKEDWLCVIQNRQIGETIIVNDVDALTKYYEEHKNEIFVGYNIRGYDQFILKGVILGFDPKDINDYIIAGGNKGYTYSSDFRKLNLNFFDVKTDINGLKQLEGFMGHDIRETTVPFDIDRKLNAKELDEVIFYCRHDVKETIKVFEERIEEFTSQLELIKMFNLPLNYIGKTKAQLSASVLEARSKARDDEFNFTIPNNLKIEKYTHVVDWFKDRIGKGLSDFYKDKLNVDIAGVPHTFAWGGLHGAIPNYQEDGFFINIDVASYYPSLMIEYDYNSRNIKESGKYSDIYRKRLEYKAMKDKRQAPLKIVLNSTYGAMKDRFNGLYDPLMANNICVTGQLFLLDLIEKLEDRFDIVQSNTDGILVKLRANDRNMANSEYKVLLEIAQEWQERTKMKLEFDAYVKVIQKDVNNYIIIDKNGNYKSKGGWVKKLSSLDYNMAIVNKALINYFVKGVSIEDTINNCNDLRDFQIIYKVSSNYSYAMYNDKKLTEKYFRVFASNDDRNTTLYKVKDGKNPEKFADCPENCFIDNSEVKGKEIPSELNKEWYIKLANKRLKDFIGE